MAKKKTKKSKKKKKKTQEPLDGVFMNYRQSRHVIHHKHAIIKVDSIDTRKQAYSLVGRRVEWFSPSGKTLSGKISKAHGKNGAVIAHFKEAGLPGQALGQKVKIK
ncbi:MAG: 50S ribosomal protein L35ae [Candidatus Lokiarchaeota archaeon]|nr:50S ribosomal protein L35ae [Candidatus Lokiarchaeota archaeon]